ncbi:MAG: hypothetical protein EHM79_14290 [Geobacter sp.]|nr:MAG: hypothetical protein EHM79_14290 [Geobacter sp.]
MERIIYLGVPLRSSHFSESTAAGRGDPAHCDNEDVTACLEAKTSGINEAGNLSDFFRISRASICCIFSATHSSVGVIVHRDFMINRRL